MTSCKNSRRLTRGRTAALGRAESVEGRVFLSSVIYVDDTSTGPLRDGSSWAAAYSDLQVALDQAAGSAGPDEIRVAAGIYLPSARADPADPRLATFRVLNGVTLLGGFPDGGGTAGQRDPAAHTTRLSGYIGSGKENSSYHVLTAADVDETAVVDGFTIIGGNARSGGPLQERNQGGGMYVVNASPILYRCNFSGNSATSGGGMYVDAGSVVDLTGCTFGFNEAAEGGGISTAGAIGRTSLHLTGCTFEFNSAQNGGGLYNMGSAELKGCTFGRNAATFGGAIQNEIGSEASLTNCTFAGNSATNWGGAIYNSGAASWLSGCTFSGNRALYGGVMYNHIGSAPELTSCTFTSNSAGNEGGALYEEGSFSSPVLTGCTFSGNSAGSAGGAMVNRWGASPELNDCTFNGNTAGYGGAIFNFADDVTPAPTLTNCTFSANAAARDGGAMYGSAASPVLVNCTLAANSAGGRGGAVCNVDGSSLSLANCILSGNTAALSAAQIQDADTSHTTATYSLVRGGWRGVGNLDSDPLFVREPSPGPDGRWGGREYPSPDDDFGDLRPRPGSPAVDAGDTTAIPSNVATDLAGQLRVAGLAVDMGAYELPVPQQLNVVGTIFDDRILVTRSGAALVVTVNGVSDTRPLGGVTSILLRGLDGNDTLEVSAGITLPAILDGGPDNDLLKGGGGNDTLLGGDGNDVLDGRKGADVFGGGAGRDAADYSGRTKAVSVGIGQAADDGEAGERDNVRMDVEDVYGGKGDDYLNGSSADNRLYGGPGNDYLVGGGGKDVLSGGAGNDRLFSRDGIKDLFIDGGSSFDSLQRDDLLDTSVAGIERLLS